MLGCRGRGGGWGSEGCVKLKNNSKNNAFCHATFCPVTFDILSCDILSCDILSCDILSCDILSCDILSCDIWPVTFCPDPVLNMCQCSL